MAAWKPHGRRGRAGPLDRPGSVGLVVLLDPAEPADPADPADLVDLEDLVVEVGHRPDAGSGPGHATTRPDRTLVSERGPCSRTPASSVVKQLEPTGDGCIVLGGEGSAAHDHDRRNAWSSARARCERRLWTSPGGRAACGRFAAHRRTGTASGRRLAGSSGATQTATIPGPTWAPRTAPSSPHQTSRPARLSARRSASRPARSRARVGVGQVGDAQVDRAVSGGLDDEVLHPAQRPGRGAHPVEVHDAAVLDPQQRLHREGTPEDRGRGPDPATPTEVLQGVDVEQRGRGCGAAARGVGAPRRPCRRRPGRRPRSARRTRSRRRPDASRPR